MPKIGVLACCICVVYNYLVCFDKESSLLSFARFSILLYICNFAVNGATWSENLIPLLQSTSLPAITLSSSLLTELG
mgnify:FL=1